MPDFDVSSVIEEIADRAPAAIVARDVPLAPRTTFGIGGPADAVVTVDDEASLVTVLAIAAKAAIPCFVLGGGSNLLVSDRGVRGLVIALGKPLSRVSFVDDDRTIAVGAGCSFPKLTRTAIDRGWSPAIGWMGTPGSVGGALVMNAGSRHGEVADVVIEVRGATADGVVVLDRSACGFGYRRSAFPSRMVLTHALLRCDSHRIEDASTVDHKARELLARRHATQPKLRSAGSIFKNPPGDFAGRLIEEAGLKGRVVGRAQISPVHANFIVNLGGARAVDVVALATLASEAVRARSGVELEWEVKRVGDFA